MIRTLGPDEAVPDSTPSRYRNQVGYIRLRWKVGVEQYVEDYEHRIVMGRPMGLEVHHLDHDKANNDPGNLLVLTPEEHTRLHQDLLRAEGRFTGRRIVRERAERKREREERWARYAELYLGGLSTVEVGRIAGLDCSNISRGLRRRGVVMRPPGWVVPNLERGRLREQARQS